MSSVAPPIAYDEPYRPARAPFLWLLEREIVRFLKIWRFSILGQVLSALLFLLVFGLALNGRVSTVQGVRYDRFILPGLVVQAMLTVGFVNGTTSLFEARNDRYIHGVLTSPLRWWEVNLALVVGGVVRQILVGLGVVLVAGPFVGFHIARAGVLAAAVLLLLVAGAQIGVLAGVYARSLDDIYSLETLLVLPLGFLSGIFYSVRSLPGAWHAVSYANPVFYFVESVRAGALGHADISPAISLAVVFVTALVLTLWSLAVFRSGKRLKP